MGRRRRIDRERVLALTARGLSVRAVAEQVGASPSAVGTILTTVRAAGWRPGQPVDQIDEHQIDEHQVDQQVDDVDRAHVVVRLPGVGPTTRAVLDNALRARLAAGTGDLAQARAALLATRAAVDAALAASDNRTVEAPGGRGVLTHQAQGVRPF